MRLMFSLNTPTMKVSVLLRLENMLAFSVKLKVFAAGRLTAIMQDPDLAKEAQQIYTYFPLVAVRLSWKY